MIDEPGYLRERVRPVKGFKRHHMKRIVVQFDPETFDEIEALAAKDKVSFAEKVRQIVEWGLETGRR